jgi:Ca2+-binding EF-hand superfamily protein
MKLNIIVMLVAVNLLFATLPAVADPVKGQTAVPKSVDLQTNEMKPADRKALVDRFNKTDLDHSNGLSLAELEKSPPQTFPNIKKHFREMDTDQNGEVTIKERDAWVTKAKSGH